MPSKYETASEEAVPIARSIIARELVGKYGLRETEVAGYLGVAQAAISKYVRKRYSRRLADRISELESKLEGHRKQIDLYIKNISEGKKEYVGICICTLCSLINGIECRFSKAAGNVAAQP